ncbi:MAG TPA: DUF4382 domain-containing protein [Candidatus Binataceae bacterium]|nr:DUF4382 domain-containing protein [Candidatus Binataceae bacterium]
MSIKNNCNRARAMTLVRIAALATIISFMVVGLWTYGPQGSVAASSGRSGLVRTHVKDVGKACIAPNGPYDNVWVTITGVQAHIVGLGWKNLTPNIMPGQAIQVDLLAEPSNECFLATLGVKDGLPAGKYTQLRVFLAPNNASGLTLLAPNTVNACDSVKAWNCVVDGNGTHVLKLTSEARTGLKIPSSQIAHGGLTLKPGQNADIDVDFNACKSIVRAGGPHSHHGAGPKFILKPVLHANEIGLNALIAGTVYEGAVSGNNVIVPTANPTVVPGAQVWLEQQSDTFTIGAPEPTSSPAPEMVEKTEAVDMTETDANGRFQFCPAGPGPYEVVVDSAGLPSSGLPSNATITTNVAGGTSDLAIPLLAEPSPTGTPAFDWAKLEGVVSTDSTTQGESVTLWALQPFANASAQTVQALIPMFDATPNGTMPTPVPPTVTTGSSPTAANCPDIASPSCPANTDCECFTLALPASNPVVGDGTTYATPAATPAAYTVGAVVNTVSDSNGTHSCSPSMLATDPNNPIDVTGGAATVAPTPTLSFVNCQ